MRTPSLTLVRCHFRGGAVKKAPSIIDDQVCTIQCFVINPSWVCCMTAQSTLLIQHVRGLFSFHENNRELSKEYLVCRNYLTSFGGKLNSGKKRLNRAWRNLFKCLIRSNAPFRSNFIKLVQVHVFEKKIRIYKEVLLNIFSST